MYILWGSPDCPLSTLKVYSSGSPQQFPQEILWGKLRDTASKPFRSASHVRFSTLLLCGKAFPCLTLKYRGLINVNLNHQGSPSQNL